MPKVSKFVAIDSEGVDVSQSFVFNPKDIPSENPLELVREVLESEFTHFVRRHRTFLWGASDGVTDSWLCSSTAKSGAAQRVASTGMSGAAKRANQDKETLSSIEILDFLTSLGDTYKNAIFVAFSFGYDAAQALAGISVKKLQKIQEDKGRGYTLCGPFGVRYLPGKYFSVARLCQPFVGKPRFKHAVTIYDVFGFFQCSFEKAIDQMPHVCSEEMRNVIKEGKAQRKDFAGIDIPSIQRYTRAELHTLVNMMNVLRFTLGEMDLQLSRWNGAGCIAGAMMRKHDVKRHYTDIHTTDLPSYQEYAHHAYFGGRIECLKYGRTKKCWVYDINSAYPHAQHSLPSMVNGIWKFLSAEDLHEKEFFHFSPLSMIEVMWFCKSFPFGPFPYRTERGAIYYPLEGLGIYTVEEVLAVIRARAKGMPVDLHYKSAWQFVEGSTEQPFDWIAEYYEKRRQIKARIKETGISDLTEYMIKLGLNSCYGKTAQSVGGREGRPPVTANPYYAAVITARTRAALLTLAMEKPHHIIAFATDGIASMVPLPICLHGANTLGDWSEEVIDGGLWVKSGVYCYYSNGEIKEAKFRGVKQIKLDSKLHARILETWKRKETRIVFDYTQYITIGMATRSEAWRDIIGCWMEGKRWLDLHPGVKREVGMRDTGMSGVALRAMPHERLVATKPKEVSGSLTIRSHPRIPEWVSFSFGDEADNEEALTKFE
ncbi:MAG: hypothetical protein MN733_07650 [Nitrososphaera sp.]|nr:hypothetical protein [Nitrososphaera sp.]